jgi:hypothetical protein
MISKKFTILMLIILIVHVWGVTGYTGTEHRIAAWLEAPRQSFKKFELFSVYLFVSNQGPDSISVPFASEQLTDALELHMTAADGKELGFSRLSHPVDMGAVPLAPGDTAMFAVTPLEVFHSGGWKYEIPPYITPAEYQLSGTYWSDHTLAPVSLKISELNEAESQIVKEYYDSSHQVGVEGQVANLAHLLTKYHDTFLGTRIAFMLLEWAGSSRIPDDQRIAYALEVLDQFPDEGVASVAYANVCTAIDDADSLIQVLEARSKCKSSIYNRFMLKEACREAGKMNVYREVMGQ